jgi:hypothetical protein
VSRVIGRLQPTAIGFQETDAHGPNLAGHPPSRAVFLVVQFGSVDAGGW